MSQLIGKTISHYRITEKIGEGGMGVVYKALDLRLKRTVAIKFLPPAFREDEEYKTRFILEARAASALDHPNICTIHEIDEADDSLFIVMSFYEGESLKQRLQKGKLSLKDTLEIMLQVCDGLEKAHQAEILHRDIKPANIFIKEDNTAKILDFGLAKMAGMDITTKNTTLGTWRYAAPEQLRGEKTGAYSDVWSLGVTMYELLSGKFPFERNDVPGAFYAIMSEDPPLLNEANPDIPDELAMIVQKTLAKKADERYPTVAALKEDLLEYAAASGSGSKDIHSKFSAPPSDIHRGEMQSYNRNQITLWGGIFIILILGIWWAYTKYIHEDDVNKPLRIAVLPFENISADSENVYFTDGVTEEIIFRISRLANVEVIARASTERYRNQSLDLAEIGETLNVEYIMTGSVRKENAQIRTSVQLIKISTQSQLWSESYDHLYEDIFNVQRNIARHVSHALELRQRNATPGMILEDPTNNLEAYKLYQKGRYYWNQRTPESIGKALEYFRQAVVLDSNFALAYSGIADALALFCSSEYSIMPASQGMPLAKQAAMQAVAKRPDLAEGHTSLANILLFYDWDIAAAEQSFLRAIELNRSYKTAHHWYAILLMISGRSAEALEEIEYAHSLDPVSLIINSEVGWLLRFARKYEDAIRQFEETRQLAPNFLVIHLNLGFTYATMGDYGRALTSLAHARTLSGGHPLIGGLVGYIHGRKNEGQAAALELAKLQKMARQGRYVNPMYRALLHMGTGNDDDFYRELEVAYQERNGYMMYLHIDPLADIVRGDQRFVDFMAKIRAD